MSKYASLILFCLIACAPVPPDAISADEAIAPSIETSDAELRDTDVRTYRVTVSNVTAGNGLSPPLLVVHGDRFSLFGLGAPASVGLALLAETGATGELEAELGAAREVRSVHKAEGDPVPAGQSRSIEVNVSHRDVARGARLNLAAMIGRSNDSFISTRSGFELRQLAAGKDIVFGASNFDAGSEENTGNVADFGSGGHPTAAAEGMVSYDRGLNLRGDAPEIIGWGPTAALVRIECVR